MIRAFVSSTYRDLHDHRAYVIDRLTQSGIFVDPMEKWTAASDEPKVLSQERVKDCQLCVLLVGFRRGHVAENETLSITQMEYREALRLGIDVLVFMTNEEADWPAAATAGLRADPETVRWRAELQEHKVVGFFTSRPESIDVDAALARWLQSRAESQAKGEPGAASDGTAAIDIRAYSNSEGVLIVWRSAQPIEWCLGFALYRRVLGNAGISDEVVTSTLGFRQAAGAAPGERVPTTRQPIQHFRWFDREQREVRYRVVPVTGTRDDLTVEENKGSNWTGWVTPRTGHDTGCRAFFNRFHVGGLVIRARDGSTDSIAARLLDSRQKSVDMREYLGGGLRRSLLELLSAAKLLEQRVYGVFQDLDDPELIASLAALGANLRIILPSGLARRAPMTPSKPDRRARVCRRLSAARVHVYEEARRKGASAARSNFAVLADRWGTPLRVWTGSAPLTSEAMCLQSNNGVLIESVALARACLDRWHDLQDVGSRIGRKRRESAPAHFRERGMAITHWGTPMRGQADLRDVRRLIRGARQGVLFLLNSSRVSSLLTDEILALRKDEDLLIEGILWSRRAGKRARHRAELIRQQEGDVLSAVPGPGINSTIVLVDPFGPHPVVITGSHDLSPAGSARDYSDLVIVEHAAGLAAEYAVYVIGLLDQYRFRGAVIASAHPGAIALAESPAWQGRFFQGVRRTQFDFLFGSLSPGV
jgi:Domain of unknown function (DUF4062)